MKRKERSLRPIYYQSLPIRSGSLSDFLTNGTSDDRIRPTNPS